MRRRDFIALVGSSAAAWSLVSIAGIRLAQGQRDLSGKVYPVFPIAQDPIAQETNPRIPDTVHS
jgi:hypothetical protein